MKALFYEAQTTKTNRHSRAKHFGLLLAINMILFLTVISLVFIREEAGDELPTVTPESMLLFKASLTAIPTPFCQAIESNGVQTLSSSDKDLNELKYGLIKYIEKQRGRYGLYYINLITQEEFGINDKDKYIAASTTKLPMNMLLYREIEAERVDPKSILTYSERDFEFGTGVIKESDFGTLYTIREAARLSIVCSDNCAMNMIISLLGIDNIRQYMQGLGGTIYYGDDHRTCPYDLAIYAAELYRFYEKSPDIAGVLIEDLQNTAWNDRINKFLPKKIKVSHKIGNFPKVYNDVGIVFAFEPYALAIMSDNVEQETASDVIATISKMIYDYVKQKKKGDSNEEQ